MLFNTSLGHGRLPSEWKSADVTPIHKKDSKELAENYRPISLLPIIGKIIERCVAKRLYDHLIDFISPLQHGFLKNRSCTTQLVQVLHTLGQNLDKNIQTDVIYLDFSKAFDSVDHRIILSKLKLHGVEGRCLDWFSDYLTDRTQRVVVDGVASNWSHVTSGVPQGSIWGHCSLYYLSTTCQTQYLLTYMSPYTLMIPKFTTVSSLRTTLNTYSKHYPPWTTGVLETTSNSMNPNVKCYLLPERNIQFASTINLVQQICLKLRRRKTLVLQSPTP